MDDTYTDGRPLTLLLALRDEHLIGRISEAADAPGCVQVDLDAALDRARGEAAPVVVCAGDEVEPSRLRALADGAPVLCFGADGVHAPGDARFPAICLNLDAGLDAIRAAMDQARIALELDRSRQLLRTSRNQFRNIIERIAEGVVIVDGHGAVRFVNPAAEKMFGRPASELMDRPFGHPVVVGDTTEIDIMRKSGSPLVAELRVVETTWEDEPMRLISLRDITDRKRAEERERRLVREQSARAVAEAAADRAAFLADASEILGSTLDPEAALSSLAHLVTESFADLCLIDLVTADGGVRRVAAVHADPADQSILNEAEPFPADPGSDRPSARVLETGEPILVRRFQEQDIAGIALSERHAEVIRRLAPRSAVIVPLVARRRIMGTVTAVRARNSQRFEESDMLLAEELARRAAIAIDNADLYRRAEEANRAKSDFLAIVSHELRTPLGAIVGYTDLLKRRIVGELTDNQLGFLDRINASSTHLLRIIDEILAFVDTGAGYEELELDRVPLSQILDQVLAVAEPLAREKDLDFKVRCQEPDTAVRTDPAKLNKILLNLLSNAIKFTESGEVSLEAGREGEHIVFRVSDTGIGIPEGKRKAIFEPFRQIEDARTRKVGGIGIGLTTARRFTDLLHGEMELESDEGRGTTFTLRLPVNASFEAIKAGPAADAAAGENDDGHPDQPAPAPAPPLPT